MCPSLKRYFSPKTLIIGGDWAKKGGSIDPLNPLFWRACVRHLSHSIGISVPSKARLLFHWKFQFSAFRFPDWFFCYCSTLVVISAHVDDVDSKHWKMESFFNFFFTVFSQNWTQNQVIYDLCTVYTWYMRRPSCVLSTWAQNAQYHELFRGI